MWQGTVVMGRRHWLWVALLVLVFAPACADSDAVSLAELSDRQASYDGRTVVVEGRVAMIEDPRHFWVEDDDFNRVGIEPGERVADHVGEQVRVRGMFSYSPDEGRSIRVEEVTLVADEEAL